MQAPNAHRKMIVTSQGEPIRMATRTAHRKA
jgi:hypothetical protein